MNALVHILLNGIEQHQTNINSKLLYTKKLSLRNIKIVSAILDVNSTGKSTLKIL